MFAYCKNNPVMYIDPTGTWGFWNALKEVGKAIVQTAVAVAAVAAVVTTVAVVASTVVATGGTAAIAISAIASTASTVFAGSVAVARVGIAMEGIGVAGGYIQSELREAEMLESKSRGKENIRDTGLSGLTDEEVRARARDKSLTGLERQRYIREEKARKQRNKTKREELY